MQKQFMRVAALGTALAVVDAGHAQSVQWRVEDGGNGHWYSVVDLGASYSTIAEAVQKLALRGGEPCVFDSSIEWLWYAQNSAALQFGGEAQFGLYRLPFGNWVTFRGDPIPYAGWGVPHLPNNGDWQSVGAYAHARGNSDGIPIWEDYLLDELGQRRWIVEWSADCNDDGIVDYGQILQGQLPDANQNGVPDGCEVPTCMDADLFRDFNVNGADLGILLSQWGLVNSLTVSDLNNDGTVDGIDLGILLGFWGPCAG